MSFAYCLPMPSSDVWVRGLIVIVVIISAEVVHHLAGLLEMAAAVATIVSTYLAWRARQGQVVVSPASGTRGHPVASMPPGDLTAY